MYTSRKLRNVSSKHHPRTDKWFAVVPGGIFFIPLTIFIPAISWWFAYIVTTPVFESQYHPIYVIIPVVYGLGLFLLTMYASSRSGCHIRFHKDKLECAAPFRRRIWLEYSKCNVGFDYHVQNGGYVWWIYLCYGEKPPYKKQNDPRNRMNTIQCQEGFVRIIYREEVYDVLMQVLPKQQCGELAWARDHAMAMVDRGNHSHKSR